MFSLPWFSSYEKKKYPPLTNCSTTNRYSPFKSVFLIYSTAFFDTLPLNFTATWLPSRLYKLVTDTRDTRFSTRLHELDDSRHGYTNYMILVTAKLSSWFCHGYKKAIWFSARLHELHDSRHGYTKNTWFSSRFYEQQDSLHIFASYIILVMATHIYIWLS